MDKQIQNQSSVFFLFGEGKVQVKCLICSQKFLFSPKSKEKRIKIYQVCDFEMFAPVYRQAGHILINF